MTLETAIIDMAENAFLVFLTDTNIAFDAWEITVAYV